LTATVAVPRGSGDCQLAGGPHRRRGSSSWRGACTGPALVSQRMCELAA